MGAFLAFRAAAFSVLRPRAAHIPCLRSLSTHITLNPRNEGIKHSIVHLVDPETGRLTGPQTLKSIIASIDIKKRYVELVTEEPAPVVKIVDKKEAFMKRKMAQEKAKAVSKKNAQKEVQLTWGAAAADTMHKLGRVREELEKGTRVDLVYSHKKGQTLPTPAEMRLRVQQTVDMMADVGAEWRPPEFKKTMAFIFLQGTATPEQEISELALIPKKARPQSIRRQERNEQRKKRRIQQQKPEIVTDDLYQD